MKTLLIITYHFPPSAASGAYRILSFAAHLPAAGWRVAVVAPPTLPWEPSDPGLASEIPAGTAVFHEPYTEHPLTKPVRKYAPYLFWVMSRWRGIRRAFEAVQPDVVMTSGPPHVVHLAGALLARTGRTRWVVDFRDPWTTGDSHLVRGNLVERLLEKYVIARADRVLWNTPGVLARMRELFPAHAARMTCVPNGYDPGVFPQRARARSGGDVPELLHTGMIYFGRDPRPLLDALKQLADCGVRVAASFLGFKPGFTIDIEAEALSRGLGQRVHVEGFVPHGLALQRMVNTDILLLLDTPGRTLGVPAKVYEYIGSGRPVLALCEPGSDTATILARSGIVHRLASPDDAQAIARALRELLPLTSGPEPSVDASHGSAVFTRSRIAHTLADVLTDLCR